MDICCNDVWFIIFQKFTFQTCIRMILTNKWMKDNGWSYISRIYFDDLSKLDNVTLCNWTLLCEKQPMMNNLRRFEVSRCTSYQEPNSFTFPHLSPFLSDIGHQLTHLKVAHAMSRSLAFQSCTLSIFATMDKLRVIDIAVPTITDINCLSHLFQEESCQIKRSHLHLYVRDVLSIDRFLQVLAFTKAPLKSLTLDFPPGYYSTFGMESLILFANNHLTCLFDVSLLIDFATRFARYIKTNVTLKGAKALKNMQLNGRHIVFWLQREFPEAHGANWLYLLKKSQRPVIQKFREFGHLLDLMLEKKWTFNEQEQDLLYHFAVLLVETPAQDESVKKDRYKMIAMTFDVAYSKEEHKKIQSLLSRLFAPTKKTPNIHWIFETIKSSEYNFLKERRIINALIRQDVEFKHRFISTIFLKRTVLEKVLMSEVTAKDVDIFACFLYNLTQKPSVDELELRDELSWYINYFFALLKHHHSTFESICTQQYAFKTKWVNFSICELQLRQFCLRNKTIRQGLSKCLDPVFAFMHFWPYSSDESAKLRYFDLIVRCVNHHPDSIINLVKVVLLGTSLSPIDKVGLFSRMDNHKAVIAAFDTFKKMGVMNADNSDVFTQVKRRLLAKRKVITLYKDDESVEKEPIQIISRKKSKTKSSNSDQQNITVYKKNK